MILWAFIPLLLLASSSRLVAQEDAVPRLPLSVLYVGEDARPGGGDRASARSKAFEAFLGERVLRFAVATHATLDPKAVAAADVVLLDWHQGSGRFPPERSPLGPRDSWSKPTVLLGSAGLHLACVWEVLGGSG